MTLAVLAVLAGAWLVYFVLWLRESRAPSATRPDSMRSFSRSLGALSRPATDMLGRSRVRPYTNQTGRGGKQFGPPRSPAQARQRRFHLFVLLTALALVSLMAAPVAGMSALAVHLLADLALVGFACGVAFRPRSRARGVSNVRELYPQPARTDDGVVVPLRRAADG